MTRLLMPALNHAVWQLSAALQNMNICSSFSELLIVLPTSPPSWMICTFHLIPLSIVVCESPAAHKNQKALYTSHGTYMLVMGDSSWLPLIFLCSYPVAVQFLQCVRTLETKISLQFHFVPVITYYTFQTAFILYYSGYLDRLSVFLGCI